MNQAMPDWRTFSTRAEATGEVDPPGGRPEPAPMATLPWALVGSVAAGVAALLVGLVILLAVLAGGLAAPGAPAPRPPEASTSGLGTAWELPAVEPAAGRAVEIVVDVAGAVAEPGLRRLRAGDRVGDAIAAAGGFAPRADLVATASGLNLAEPLSDGMKVYVPVLGTAAARPASGDGSGLIDINSADQALLESLPGVGPVTAQRIMEARAEQRFGSVDELRARGVLGNAVFEDVRDLVRAG